jgi:ferric-dicitrate binding protein FerR (iron transport regulator)
MSYTGMPIDDDLLVKYLVGEATPAEVEAIQNWIAASPANRQDYDNFKLIWDESRHIASTKNIDEDAAYMRLQKRLNNTATAQPTKLREAFFKVTPDKTKPFIIKVNGVTVRVVGTSFNVKSRDGKTLVIVETGIVNVSEQTKNVNLNPGEKVLVTKKDGLLAKESIKGRLYNYYATHELVCDETPLHELVSSLNEIYGAHIVIANKAIANLPITTVFKDQSLDQVLLVISETFKIKVERGKKGIVLK